ncbi:MAG: hypothetical protein H7331_02145 [Bacteroidia bacterium]|nr:hypothetical protein [Bacteroidia bacterium]
MTLILRLRSVTNLTLAKANQFNNKLWNTCGNGEKGMNYMLSKFKH